jgi:para-nitrobenzyl esterase
MMGALIAFATTASPKTAAVPWPAWSAAHEQRMVFGETIELEDLNTAGMDWLAAHPATPLERSAPARVTPRD